MDFLNRAFGQVTDLLKSMTPAARITAGLLLTMVVISLAFLMRQAGSDQDAFLMGGEVFSSDKLNNMEAAFAKANLSDYRIDGNRIRVRSGQQSAYMGALADGGALPPTFGKYLERTVGSSSIMQDRELRRQATKIATQNELQLILSNMKGIETAAVMYDIEEAGPFGKQRIVTASVCIKTTTGQPLEDDQVRTIRHTVAPAIGAKAENISVTDLNGQVYPASGGGGLVGGSEDPYGSRKRMYEREWRDKVAATLGYIPGVLVTANVELDPEIEHVETRTDYDPKAVPFNTTESNKTAVTKSGTPSARPGVAAQNGVNQPATVGGSGASENTQEEGQVETQSAVPSTVRRVAQQGLTPRRVAISISIPSSYFEKVWSEQNPVQPGAQAQKPDAAALKQVETTVKKEIEDAVVALLPQTPNRTADLYPQVKVTTFQSLPAPPMPVPSLVNTATDWLSRYWQTLGMIGVGLVGLLMLRSMVRAVPAAMTHEEQSEAFAARFPESTQTSEGQPAVPPTGQAVRNRLKRRTPHGPSLREELSELVKEDPDTAVNVLRAWIGNSGQNT